MMVFPGVRQAGVVAAVLAAGWLMAGTSVPPLGGNAPPVELRELGGERLSTAKLAPRTVVLVFGEVGHEGARQTCEDVLEAVRDPRLAGAQIVPALIIAEEGVPRQLRERAAQGKYPAIIFHDPKREAFEAYHVVAIPTVVVIDGSGRIVQSMPGFLQRFRETLVESLLVATGRADAAELQRVLDPRSQEPAHDLVRADRLARIGDELARAGLLEMSEARYKEAVGFASSHVGARLGLGEVYLRLRREADAEGMFRAVLASCPESREATVGLAAAKIARGDADIEGAVQALRGVVGKDPTHARAHLLLGRIYEKRGESAAALAEYRSAAESALGR